MNMYVYHELIKSNTLPLDNKDIPSIVLLSFASFFLHIVIVMYSIHNLTKWVLALN